jgi:general secretion pathway protein N
MNLAGKAAGFHRNLPAGIVAVLGLLLGAIVCGDSEASALAATEPVATAIEFAINPPMTDPSPDTSRLNEPAAPTLTGNPLSAIALKSLTFTRERPLFSRSRRPPAPAIVAAPSAPPAPPPPPKLAEPDHPLLTLVGTIVGESQSIGIFVDQVAKSVIRLKTGQDHAGWTLRAVQGREAIFEKDRREETLALPARSATNGAPPSVSPLTMVAAQPGGTWKDGDGQLIGPPSLAQMSGDQTSATWRDGDGQLVSRPSAPPLARISGNQTSATWRDGDGQLVSAPPRR